MTGRCCKFSECQAPPIKDFLQWFLGGIRGTLYLGFEGRFMQAKLCNNEVKNC